MVKALLAGGAKLSTTLEYGMNALQAAARSGHVAAMRALLAVDASLASQSDQFRLHPIHYAAVGGSVDALRLLLDEYNAPLEVRDARGQFALLRARRC